MKLLRPIIVLDLETTGTWLEKDRIVEIGMIRRCPDGQTESYVRRVNPGMPIPPSVSEVIGITDEDIKDKPPFKEIAAEVFSFIGDADLAGYNVERFDLPILKRELVGAGYVLETGSRNILDAQHIYHFHERRDLTAAYKYYCEKELVNAHSALGDAEATLEILEAQVKKYAKGDGDIEEMLDFRLKRIGDFFDSERKFRWWNRELFPTFGKYARRKNLRQIAESDPEYLEWIAGADFSEEVRELVKGALIGRFPEFPQ